MELDRITNPLRLARGSHQPGSGKGCAMNVISYIKGDAQVTDFPIGSARPLVCGPVHATICWRVRTASVTRQQRGRSYLAWPTVGLADVPDTVATRGSPTCSPPRRGESAASPGITAPKAILDIAAYTALRRRGICRPSLTATLPPAQPARWPLLNGAASSPSQAGFGVDDVRGQRPSAGTGSRVVFMPRTLTRGVNCHHHGKPDNGIHRLCNLRCDVAAVSPMGQRRARR